MITFGFGDKQVQLSPKDGILIVKMLHLPRLPEYIIHVDQLVAFRSAVVDHLQWDGELERIGNTIRNGHVAQNTAQYMSMILKELSLLAHDAIKEQSPITMRMMLTN